MQKTIMDQTLFVKTTEANTENTFGEAVQTQYDRNLCEGFQVLVGNKQYDYGVRKCELV
jgi:hypothetical protein